MNRFICFIITLGLLAGTLGAAAEDSGTGVTLSKPAMPESFQIRNKKFGDLLRPEDANSADGTRIVLYPAQSWKCLTWKLHPVGGQIFQVQNHFTSKTFSHASKADGGQQAMVQVPFSRDTRERPAWRFTKLPDGLYQIIEVESGMALTAVAASGGGAKVVLAPQGQNDEQKWELIKTDPSRLTM